ncbi:unnamed protein product [Acanthoscelides obtectus]|uniref:Uncharacterized protein n=1 Tax=Acanthoscelides obtectus TaxID=200917 RepID=A0A9P0MJM7_ACAOB|nr:unnamed protein product [Acanthoscelides obtectus]CAK1628319.1 hypothetical protein AOBTE_LOCUS5135 [Acanthoscelides obtectus]
MVRKSSGLHGLFVLGTGVIILLLMTSNNFFLNCVAYSVKFLETSRVPLLKALLPL